MKRFLLSGPSLAWFPLLALVGAMFSYVVAWALIWLGTPRLSDVRLVDTSEFIPHEIGLPMSVTTTRQPMATWHDVGLIEAVLFPVDWGDWGDTLGKDAVCSSLQGLLTARDDDAPRERAMRQTHTEMWNLDGPPPVLRAQAGWPFRCVQGWGPASTMRGGRSHPILPNTLPAVRAVVRSRTIEGQPELRLLPWSPLWPGLLANSFLYASAMWTIFAIPFALRRRRRIKRGLCPKCAYPVGAGAGAGTNAVCTECGAAVRPIDPDCRTLAKR